MAKENTDRNSRSGTMPVMTSLRSNKIQCCRRPQRQRRGFTTTTALFLVALALLTVFVMASVSMTQVRLSTRGQARVVGLTLAEAGIDDTVDRLRLDPDYSKNGPSRVQLFEDPDTQTKSLGWYRVRVEEVPGEANQRKVTSTALRPDGVTSMEVQMVAIVRLDTMPLGSKYAILSNGPIRISGNATITTKPANLHIADVRSNSDIVVGGSSDVDGGLYSSGTVTGQGYYPSKGNLPKIYFPSVATTDAWKADWITTSKRTNQVIQGNSIGSSGGGGSSGTGGGAGSGSGSGGGSSSSSSSGPTVITAPAYIQGDIKLTNLEQVVFQPAADPKDSVIYVDGSVDMGAQSQMTNQGVTVVVGKAFRQNGQALYTVTSVTPSPTPTLVVYGTGFAAGDNTLILNGGGSTYNQGVVYVVNGDALLNGTNAFIGSLIVGAPDSGVLVSGAYNQYYPEKMASPVQFYSAARVESVVEM